MQSREDKIGYLKLLKERSRRKSKEDLLAFTMFNMSSFEPTDFHKSYYKVLNLFAKGVIKNLITTMPPQHGKSTGSTMYLPSFMFGLNPDLKIAISSYSTPITQRFNRSIQRIIDTKEYVSVFPNTNLGQSNVVTVMSQPIRNASEFEIIDLEGNIRGKLMSVGRGGALTSQSVDIWIGDDLYKDYAEGNSPIARDSVWDWYLSVPLSRQPKQKLLVFTRWNEDDAIGRIEKKEKVVECGSIEDVRQALLEHGEEVWIKINFEAIKTGSKTEFDNRDTGEALWNEERPLKKLEAIRALDPEQFNCLYQGDPQSKEGLLYKAFKTYTDIPPLKKVGNYTDTADTGTDYLCSIVYGIPLSRIDKHIYILDILYTQESMETTEEKTIDLLNKNKVNQADVESNNGGRSFARVVQKGVNTVVKWFHQGNNKEARIFSNSASVNNTIVFPSDWHIKHPTFYDHVTKYKKLFSANKFDDTADTLTGIVEKNASASDEFDPE